MAARASLGRQILLATCLYRTHSIHSIQGQAQVSMKDKSRRHDDDADRGSPFDPEDEASINTGEPENHPFGADLPETQIRALALVDDLLRQTPRADPRFPYLMLLRHQVQTDEKQFDEAQELMQQYEEAYNKLTSPANRIATFLGTTEDGLATVALGESEFRANIDPNTPIAELKIGTRVAVNEAYAVLKNLGCSTSGPVVKISDVLDEQRLRVSLDSQGMSSRVVVRSDELSSAVLTSGDEVRMEPSFHVAIEHFPQHTARDYFMEEVPAITWEQVGGQEEAIRLIRDTIELPMLYPEIFERFEKRPLKGILLYGPPGCGKTLIGKATAYNLTQEYRRVTGRDVQEYFMLINGPKILNMWLGETERMVREIFATAREKAQEGHLVFIFVDEAESVLRTRSSGRWLNISNTVVPQFCAEMDGLVALENVVVILTSNRPDYIDPAVLRPDRIDRKVKVARPDRAASRQILSIYLNSRLPLAPALLQAHEGDAEAARQDLLDQTVSSLWRAAPETEFLQVYFRNGGVETMHWRDLVRGALLKSVVDRAKDSAIKRSIDSKSDSDGIGQEDLEHALRTEYKENEIFPKSDSQEDWLKLLDYEPENVVRVRPIRPERMGRDRAAQSGVI
jgi:proteasome-associated ATPase